MKENLKRKLFAFHSQRWQKKFIFRSRLINRFIKTLAKKISIFMRDK